jgi:hypothetical protein
MITTFQNLEKSLTKFSHQTDCMDHIKVGNDIVTFLTIILFVVVSVYLD